MGRKRRDEPAHTGRTSKGHVREVVVERIGNVTIYKRGTTYSLYYRENRQTERRKIDGNLAVARATAAKVSAALNENRPSPLGFQRTTPQQVVEGYLDYVSNVQQLAWRTADRYRAALTRFRDFCDEAKISAIDAIDERTVEDFVRWLRAQTRVRNGRRNGKRGSYLLGGIKFILSTCRTAFNWAARRRMLPPYADNPFCRFRADQLRDPNAEDVGKHVFSANQEREFFNACTEWQRGIFLTLACFGMRAGELTHLLVEDVDLDAARIRICSKPEMFWRVKTSRRRELPLVDELQELFARLVGDRRAGFVFLREKYVTGADRPARRFETDSAFRNHLKGIADTLRAENPQIDEKDVRKAVMRFGRSMGQLRVKEVQNEFCRLTLQIGCPEFTRTHDLRHLFSSRAQEAGTNPLLVQDILGHATLDMTRRYTHFGSDAKTAAVSQLLARLGQSHSSENATSGGRLESNDAGGTSAQV